MCRLHLTSGGNIASDTLLRLTLNSPGGVLFPKLEWLHWDFGVKYIALTFFRLFLSPNLRRVTLYTDSSQYDIPWGQLAALVQVISFLPTSLQDLSIMFGSGDRGTVNNAVSSFFCRCGPSLRSFGTSITFSEAAVHHLMQLPGLRYWTAAQGPTSTIPTSIFPSLEHLHLYEPAALPWLHLLASHEWGVPRNGFTSATSHPNIREMLKSLNCCQRIAVNSASLSSIGKFRNLVELRMHTDCSFRDGCTFYLIDHDMEILAVALPRLKALRLGPPCHSSSCNTTVASLMSISVHCLDLTVLEAHFDTSKIASVMQCLLHVGSGRGKARCKLRSLLAGHVPLPYKADIEVIAMGFKAIFPYLTEIEGFHYFWHKLNQKLGDYWEYS